MSNIALRPSWRPVPAPGAWSVAWAFLFTKPRGRRLAAAVPTAAEIYRLIEASCLLGALGLSLGLLAVFVWKGL